MSYSSPASDGFWIPSDSASYSNEFNQKIDEIGEIHPSKFDVMDLPIDEEISQTYDQIMTETNQFAGSETFEASSQTDSYSFISLFKLELLLAASAVSEEITESKGSPKCLFTITTLNIEDCDVHLSALLLFPTI